MSPYYDAHSPYHDARLAAAAEKSRYHIPPHRGLAADVVVDGSRLKIECRLADVVFPLSPPLAGAADAAVAAIAADDGFQRWQHAAQQLRDLDRAAQVAEHDQQAAQAAKTAAEKNGDATALISAVRQVAAAKAAMDDAVADANSIRPMVTTKLLAAATATAKNMIIGALNVAIDSADDAARTAEKAAAATLEPLAAAVRQLPEYRAAVAAIAAASAMRMRHTISGRDADSAARVAEAKAFAL